MALNVEHELAILSRTTVRELQQRFAEVFGEQPRGRHKDWLVKKIIWRLQTLAEGDLTERARRRAGELANDADLRVTAPRRIPTNRKNIAETPVSFSTDRRLPMPSTRLTREYKGRRLEVEVLEKGFAFEGEYYKSLSAIAKKITGKHWNGFLFFGLSKGGKL
jgi:hypothetical protein